MASYNSCTESQPKPSIGALVVRTGEPARMLDALIVIMESSCARLLIDSSFLPHHFRAALWLTGSSGRSFFVKSSGDSNRWKRLIVSRLPPATFTPSCDRARTPLISATSPDRNLTVATDSNPQPPD